MSEGNFKTLFLEAVDEGLSSLGDSPKQAIYFHLDKRFHIKKEEIPDKVEPFEDALRKIFGPGSDFVGTLIKRRLAKKVLPNSEIQTLEGLKLSEYVAEAKRDFQEKCEQMEVDTVQCEQPAMES